MMQQEHVLNIFSDAHHLQSHKKTTTQGCEYTLVRHCSNCFEIEALVWNILAVKSSFPVLQPHKKQNKAK